ncbi:trypsin-like peptidase domain-containing protein [Streptomyces sp. BE147]|uniref:VMAP-C domain-containing protein n=1 Tax=Streptomyces sp. BE147 TaxID=3002524 RepID=UPI002E7806E4|nr:trypsin-like peptidase domain-containing protein [Streptomyces sp. BE147]MEE1739687.1 trypsin-like peptidase domain-containing protein [Streptomyces sp. BE147]
MRLDVTPSLADAPLHRAFVSVLGRDQPVGAGVLLSPTLVLTCAHVINSALGRHRFDAPVPSRGQQIGLRFPHVDRERELIGRVLPHCWRPPRSRPEADRPSPPGAGALPYYGDLAVVELDTEAPPGAEPAPFLTHRDGNEVVAQWASGHALPTLRAMPRVSSHPWIALDVLGGTVAEGFSGGPLWDRSRQAVVGLVVAAHESRAREEGPAPAARYAPPAAMYAIGLSSIESELPGLPPVAVPAAGRGRQQLLGALEKLLPTRREVMACEERLAARLGRRSSGPAADIERLAGMAMGVRRGVPELLNIVYEQLAELRAGSPATDPDWERALGIARIVSPRERLSSGQRRNLNALLAECRATEPDALVRTVLPYADEVPRPCDLADATDILECYDPQPGQPMPPLLQGVIHISVQERASGAYLADDLDAWVRSTAPRLGVAPAAVAQFRADVSAHAGARGARPPRTDPPRVQVELLPVSTGHLFTYQIWVWSGDGRHEVVLTEDTEVSSHRVVEAIRQVLRTEVEEHPETALVEFFVAPAWLRLDVDAWEFPGSADDGGFRPGITRRVVLRSSERTRETHAGWKRRSSALPSSPRLLLDQRSCDPAVAQARLEVNPEAGIVVVCCDRQHQGLVLRQCIQAGVHTVLWHREEHGGRIAADLLALVEGVDHAHIPEAVRLERAKAMADPDCTTHHGRELSLLHDGPNHRPPPLAPAPWALIQP